MLKTIIHSFSKNNFFRKILYRKMTKKLSVTDGRTDGRTDGKFLEINFDQFSDLEIYLANRCE